MSEKTILHLIRHGQSAGNTEHRVQGQIDSPLSELGRAQAAALAEGFKVRSSWQDPPIAAVYTSDLQRARDTAAMVAEVLGLPLTEDVRLRETDFGEVEGMRWEEVIDQHGPIEKLLNPSYVFPGGESRVQAVVRAWPAIEGAMKEHAGKTVVVVCHGAVISAFMRRVAGVPNDVAARVVLYNTAVSTYVYSEGAFRMACFGETGHLDAAGLKTTDNEAKR